MFGVAIVFATVAMAASAEADLPSGWIYIENEGIDAASGAYHDSFSGLFVWSEVTLPGVVVPAAEAKARRHGASSEREKIGDLASWRVTVPSADGCYEMVATITRSVDAVFWNVSGLACGESQRKRLASLLHELPRRIPGFPGQRRGRYLTADDTHGLLEGASWEDIRNRLGPPRDVEAAARGGLVVTYEVGRKLLRLHFDQQQVLRTIENQK